MKTLNYNVDWKSKKSRFTHTWEGLVNIDQFRWMTREDVRTHLKMAHKELKAKHVRAVGMFDDELKVFCIDPKNFANENIRKCRMNFRNIDYITDFLLENGIYPMITTTFIPSEMASGENTVFETKSRTDMPKNMSEWQGLIDAYVRHITQRYGEETVRKFYFEVWNEPNLKPFFPGSYNDFLNLWSETYKAIKNVSVNYRVGGPSTARSE